MTPNPQIRPGAAAHAAGAPVVERSDGPVVAALLALGIGSFTLGLLTTLAETSESVADWLRINEGVGPLSGKTTFAVVVWLVAWAVLHFVLRARARLTNGVLVTTGVLIALGLLGTFPVFFQLFADE
jgi:fluoride ion exporter CrcB/FEX